ncbi:MAG: hypothetical protein R3B70_47545 [Polyangiaceae bacterium]
MHHTDPSKPLESVTLTSASQSLSGARQGSVELVGAREERIEGCIWAPAFRRCADESTRTANTSIENRFAKPVTADVLESVVVHTDGALKGSGRTIAEGAKAAGWKLAPRGALGPCCVGGDREEGLQSCIGSGDSLCYQAHAER